MSMAMTKSYQTWFRCGVPRSRPRLRLFCFPHAGGAASYFRTWSSRIPDSVETLAVQYPGREERIDDVCIDEMNQLADHIVEAMIPSFDHPIALFGHSMGAAVAYEVARRLEARKAHLVRLFVSSHPAPHLQRENTVHLLDDDGLVADIRRLGGTNETLLEHEELRALLLPPLRNDYRLIETYKPRPGPKLTVPVVAYVGDSDPDVNDTEARGWVDVTSGSFNIQIFAGDHFYLVPKQADLIADMTRYLSMPLPPGR